MSEGFEFDPQKAADNLKKHRVALSDTEEVFYDPLAIQLEDVDAEQEQRLVAIGRGSAGTILVVAYTYRGDAIRDISARRASRKKRLQYETRVRLL